MLKIIGILAIVIVVLLVVRIMLQSKQTAAKFELPDDTDKDYFVDPKNGKKYDREAYLNYMTRTAQGLSVQQLKNMVNQRAGQGDIWNELMCEAMRAELERRAAEAEAAEDLEEEISDEIEPFFWVEQNIGASIGLSCGEYLQELFDENGMDGTGSDWDALAKAFLKGQPDLEGSIQFDSQADLFCAYSRDEQALRRFAAKFRAACEDEAAVKALFAGLNK